MYAILSPAKKLVTPLRQHSGITTPELAEDADQLVRVMRDKTPDNLKTLMGISENLAQLNVERFQTYTTPFTRDNSTPAALTFAGDTYQGLQADTLSDEDLTYAQMHVGILSGLFGLLRPLDLMQPYRLEMGTRLETDRGKNLYQFWGDKITDLINGATKGHADRSVINLASKEYFSAVVPAKLEGPVITPVFKDVRNGKAKVISFLAKRARGSMARYIIDERIETAQDLKGFSSGGYTFKPEVSTNTEWVFERPDISTSS